MPATNTLSWNELTPEERFAYVADQLNHWRRMKRLLIQEQQARTGEERAALREELRSRLTGAAATLLA